MSVKNQVMTDEDGADDNSGDESGVVIPEQFQKDTHALMKSATTKHHVSHIRSRLNEREDEMRKAEQAAEKKAHPENFSKDSMPSSY